eukprot:588441-Rhodomonas_salina.1
MPQGQHKHLAPPESFLEHPCEGSKPDRVNRASSAWQCQRPVCSRAPCDRNNHHCTPPPRRRRYDTLVNEDAKLRELSPTWDGSRGALADHLGRRAMDSLRGAHRSIAQPALAGRTPGAPRGVELEGHAVGGLECREPALEVVLEREQHVGGLHAWGEPDRELG